MYLHAVRYVSLQGLRLHEAGPDVRLVAWCGAGLWRRANARELADMYRCQRCAKKKAYAMLKTVMVAT